MNFPLEYKAAQLKEGKVFLRSNRITREQLGESDVVVKIKYMGICRADAKEVVGSRDIPDDRGPLFGHEIVGEVYYAGKDTNFTSGQLVTFNPNITPERTTGYAELFRITGTAETLAKALIAIPAGTSMDPEWQPEPFACIVHTIRVLLSYLKVETLEGKKVGIIGAGNSGAQFGLYAKYLQAQVVLFNRNSERLSFLESRGLFDAAELKNLSQTQNFEGVFDVVVVVPTKIDDTTLAYAHKIVKENGSLLLYGGTRKNDTYLDSKEDIDSVRRQELMRHLTYQDKFVNIIGAYGCGIEDFDEAIRLYSAEHDSFPLEKMKSHEISLDEFPELIENLATGAVDYPGKVIVHPAAID